MGKKSSKYHGVFWNTKTSKWVSFLQLKDNRIYLGVCESEEEALGRYIDACWYHKEEMEVPSLDGEEWGLIDGYNGRYMVSNMGRILSFLGKTKVLAPGRSGRNRNYRTVRLPSPDGPKSFYVHRLVADAFIDNPLGLPQINHIDSDPGNNHIDNLEWCTCKENINHAISKGRMLVGDKNGNYKKSFGINSILNEEQVAEIKWRLINEYKWGLNKELADEYGVQHLAICRIKTERTWTWVEPKPPISK